MGNTRIKVYLNLKSHPPKERINVRDRESIQDINIFQIRIPQKEIIETAKRKLLKKKENIFPN